MLDRLLEDGSIQIRGLSGASAGAMNAVVLASGYGTGGRDEARRRLRSFWETVGRKQAHNPLGVTMFDTLFGHWAPLRVRRYSASTTSFHGSFHPISSTH
ncbi:hypothetical protein [Marinobacterium aestuariivivens]|uniref:PNPLA domain-containing protein n=1 Tax=Marinobacterium aestuariivivens TaxID=1698799 RepID=A0ABW1ZV60_9GAMM